MHVDSKHIFQEGGGGIKDLVRAKMQLGKQMSIGALRSICKLQDVLISPLKLDSVSSCNFLQVSNPIFRVANHAAPRCTVAETVK